MVTKVIPQEIDLIGEGRRQKIVGIWRAWKQDLPKMEPAAGHEP